MKILTKTFNTKYETAPFSQIKMEDYKPAFEENIATAKAEIDAIINNPEAPTFENTLEALDFAGNPLDRLSSVFFNLNSAETSEEMQKIDGGLDTENRIQFIGLLKQLIQMVGCEQCFLISHNMEYDENVSIIDMTSRPVVVS